MSYWPNIIRTLGMGVNILFMQEEEAESKSVDSGCQVCQLTSKIARNIFQCISII